MDNRKDNQYYINKIVSDLSFLIKHTEGLTQEDLEANEILIDSVMFRLIQISESSDKLTDEFKSTHNTIPWRAMKGLRNRIVHEYGNVNLSIVYNTVTQDLPMLLIDLTEITKRFSALLNFFNIKQERKQDA